MAMKRKIQELQKKREIVLKGGGEKAIEKQAFFQNQISEAFEPTDAKRLYTRRDVKINSKYIFKSAHVCLT